MAGLKSAVAIVGLHYVANLSHGVVHAGIPVALTATQTAFVVLVVSVGPLFSLWSLRRQRAVAGWGTLAAILFASFCFGVVFHYVVASPDNVAHVPEGPWNLPFDATAALVAIVDAGGALVAVRNVRSAHARSSTDTALDRLR